MDWETSRVICRQFNMTFVLHYLPEWSLSNQSFSLPAFFRPNQWSSRHRRSDILALCVMTQRLFDETPRSLQISSDATPSTSFITNTCATLSGSCARQR